MSDKPNTTTLPDGWRLFDKYQIRHTDGTPLKGKRYFVLRLDTDDPAGAARVAAAMSAYKGETQGNAAKLRETLVGIKSLLGSINEVTNDDAAAILMNIDLALRAPARNCEVGTWRFESFCNRFRHDYCRGCSLGEEFFENHEIGECRLAWAQRKYESEVAKRVSISSSTSCPAYTEHRWLSKRKR